MKPRILFLFAVATILLGACTKAKSNRWLVCDITVVDAITNEPIRGKFDLAYTSVSLLGSGQEFQTIGESDLDGRFVHEMKVNRKNTNYTLKFDAYGSYGWPYEGHYEKVISLSSSSKNEHIIQLMPTRVGTLIINNSLCHDETDSLWLKFPNDTAFRNKAHVGCLENDTISDWFWTQEINIEIESKSKKNGVYQILTHSFSPSPGTENLFVVNY